MALDRCFVFQNRTPVFLFRVAHRTGQTQLSEDSFFLLTHPHGFQTTVLVVIAQQMEHGVDRQESDLSAADGRRESPAPVRVPC